MHDREQRLAWIESLMASRAGALERRSLAVIPVVAARGAADGKEQEAPDDAVGAAAFVGVPFEHVLEVAAGSAVTSIALLPPTYCGVIAHGSELCPIIDLRSNSSQPELVLVIRDRDAIYGLLFCGTPHVLDADAGGPAAHVPLPWPLVVAKSIEGPRGPVALLDVQATTDALLAG